TSPLSQKLWFHPVGLWLSSDRFSRPAETHLRACQIWLEPPCRVALSVSRNNDSQPFFSRSQESRQEPCQAPQSHPEACSCPRGVFVWHSEELVLPLLPLDSETLPQRNPSVAWLSQEEDELAETSPVGTSTVLTSPSAHLRTNVTQPVPRQVACEQSKQVLAGP